MYSDERNCQNVWIIDSTLRDGEQSAGIVFSCEEKIKIAKALADTGIQEIEVGTPSIGNFEVEIISEIVKLNLDCRLTAWCRAFKNDIDMAVSSGVNAVHISFPVSKLHINSINKNEGWIFENLEKQIKYAKNFFPFVSVGAQDASRSETKFLFDFIRLANSFGADRVRIADTIGVLNPFQTYKIISRIKHEFSNLLIDFHGHNDLGMATANALSAIQAGAESVSVTINGLGERAGNTALEEFVMALKYSSGIDNSMKTVNLLKLSEMVADYSGIPIPSNKPVVGKNIFRHESGIHCKGILFDRNTYELFHPEEIGGKPEEFVIGKHSGTAGLAHILKKDGIILSEEELKLLLEKIKTLSIKNKKSISKNELIYLSEDVRNIAKKHMIKT
jgi:homocitrate synthase NifV